MTYRQRTWSDESEMWCGICDVPSDECVEQGPNHNADGDEMEAGHAAHWITMQERAREEAESDAYERGHDAEETQGN